MRTESVRIRDLKKCKREKRGIAIGRIINFRWSVLAQNRRF